MCLIMFYEFLDQKYISRRRPSIEFSIRNVPNHFYTETNKYIYRVKQIPSDSDYLLGNNILKYSKIILVDIDRI